MTDGDLWIPSDDELTWLAQHDPARATRLLHLMEAEAASLRGQHHDPIPGSAGALAAMLTANKELERPHLQLIDREMARATSEPVRLIINIGPRYGKTRRVRWNILHLLQQIPESRFIYSSYADNLADESARWVRDQFERHNLTCGKCDTPHAVRPRRDTRRADRWWIEGHEGGMLAAGIGGGITGFGGHLIVDDVVKDAEQARSKQWMDRVWRWYTETAYDRLEPGCSVVILMTRWSDDDLTGRLEREQPGVWTVIRIPTVAEPGDILQRPVGQLLWPDRYDDEAVKAQRATLGAFAFSARHQQKPLTRSGGVWTEDQIRATHREGEWDALELATRLSPRCVAVDPSASEEAGGDEAGIVCGGRDSKAGVSWVLADLSGLLTPDGWARRALVAAVELDCDIVYESNLTPVFMKRTLKQGWAALQREAREADDGMVDRVLGVDRIVLPGLMPAIKPVRAKVGKELRAEPVAQLYEQELVLHAHPFPVLEGQMLTWRPAGRVSPDRMDAAVHLLTWLGDRAGQSGSVHGASGRLPSTSGVPRRGGLAGPKVALGKRQGF